MIPPLFCFWNKILFFRARTTGFASIRADPPSHRRPRGQRRTPRDQWLVSTAHATVGRTGKAAKTSESLDCSGPWLEPTAFRGKTLGANAHKARERVDHVRADSILDRTSHMSSSGAQWSRICAIAALAVCLLGAPLPGKAQSIRDVKVTTKAGQEPHTLVFYLQITGKNFETDEKKVTVIVTPQGPIYKPGPQVAKVSQGGTEIEASFIAPDSYVPQTVLVHNGAAGFKLTAGDGATSDPYILPGSESKGGRLKDIKVYRSILDPKVVADVFGRRIARRFIVMQVTITNRSSNYQFLIHDVSLDLRKVFSEEELGKHREMSSIELSLLRGVAEQGQLSDPRNLILRILRGSGTIAAGLIGVSHFGHSYSSAVAVFNGPVLSAYAEALPDRTINQMNRLNDSAYSANSVIPKQQAKVMAIFLPQAIFLNSDQRNAFWKDPTSLWTCKGGTQGGKGADRTGAEDSQTVPCVKQVNLPLLEVFVDGNFITEVEGLVPTLTSVVIDPEEMKKFQGDKSEVKGYVSGRFLAEASVKLLDGDKLKGTTIELDGAPTDEKLKFTVKSDLPIAPGQVLKIGIVKKDSTKEIDEIVQYPAAIPTITKIKPDALNQGQSEQTVTLTCTNLLPKATTVLVDPLDGLTAGTVDVKSSTELDVKLSVSKDAKEGKRKVSVRTLGSPSPSSVDLTINKSASSGAAPGNSASKPPKPQKPGTTPSQTKNPRETKTQ